MRPSVGRRLVRGVRHPRLLPAAECRADGRVAANTSFNGAKARNSNAAQGPAALVRLVQLLAKAEARDHASRSKGIPADISLTIHNND